MNHKLHGEWRSWVVVDADGVLTVKNDREIYLRMTKADTGDVETGSNHMGKALTGKATQAGNDLRIELKQISGSVTRTYNGVLSVETDVLGQKVMVIAGSVINAHAAKSKKRAEVTAAADGQEEGTWVATKP